MDNFQNVQPNVYNSTSKKSNKQANNLIKEQTEDLNRHIFLMTQKEFLIWLSFDFSSETLGRSEGSRLIYLKCGRNFLLTHYQGQGQKPGGPQARRAAAKRSYPTSEVRGSGWECQTAMAQEQLRGATPRPRSGAAAGRNYPTPPSPRPGAAAGRNNPTTQGQGQRPRGPAPCPRSHGCEGAGGPRGAIPRWRSGRAAVRRYPSSKVRSSTALCWSSHEEIPHTQGKRNPSKMAGVARGHQRVDTL